MDPILALVQTLDRQERDLSRKCLRTGFAAAPQRETGYPDTRAVLTSLAMEAQPRITPVPESPANFLRVLMPSPIGSLGVELLSTAFTRVTIEPAEPLRSSFTPLHLLDGSDPLDEIFGRLAEYFAGARRKLDLEFDLAVCGVAAFVRRVLKETTKIPYGKTRTYQEVAEACGRSECRPEVLAILRENPIPVVIPCHRVIAEDGGLGEYVGGCKRKLWLLELESQGAEIL